MIAARADDLDVIFDRCPVDFIAYLEVLGEAEGGEWMPTGKMLTGIERALAAIDLLVFLPLSKPDQIATRIELPRLRSKVDTRLKTILRDDSLGLLRSSGARLLELRGSREDRLRNLSENIAE
jgi:hypothetical protein